MIGHHGRWWSLRLAAVFRMTKNTLRLQQSEDCCSSQTIRTILVQLHPVMWPWLVTNSLCFFRPHCLSNVLSSTVSVSHHLICLLSPWLYLTAVFLLLPSSPLCGCAHSGWDIYACGKDQFRFSHQNTVPFTIWWNPLLPVVLTSTVAICLFYDFTSLPISFTIP